MTKVTVLYGQTLLDIAIEALGDADRIDEVASLNGLDITDDIIAGDELIVPDVAFDKKSLVAINFNKNTNKPASALNTNVFILDEWEAYYDNGEDDWDVYFGYTG